MIIAKLQIYVPDGALCLGCEFRHQEYKEQFYNEGYIVMIEDMIAERDKLVFYNE